MLASVQVTPVGREVELDIRPPRDPRPDGLYELWFVSSDGRRRVSAGTFHPDEQWSRDRAAARRGRPEGLSAPVGDARAQRRRPAPHRPRSAPLAACAGLGRKTAAETRRSSASVSPRTRRKWQPLIAAAIRVPSSFFDPGRVAPAEPLAPDRPTGLADAGDVVVEVILRPEALDRDEDQDVVLGRGPRPGHDVRLAGSRARRGRASRARSRFSSPSSGVYVKPFGSAP